MWMLLSWKATFDKNQWPRWSHLSDDQKEIVLKKQRTNINKYYLDYARIKIAEAWEKWESASTWIGKPLKKWISRNARTIAQTLDLPTPESIWWSALPTVLSQLPPTQKKKKKKFTKSSLTSLFQQTWDAELDNMLDTWREYVEDAAFYKPALKPWQILLRKKIEDNEFSEPYMYEFKVMKPKYLQKYFPDTNS